MSNAVEACINNLIQNDCGKNFAIRYGTTDSYTDVFSSEKINAETSFDMASVTKITVTTPLCLIAFDEGRLSPDTLVSEFFNCPKDKTGLTIKQLLTHSIGFGHKPLNYPDVNYGNVAEYILSIPCEFPVGTKTEYSCPAFILLGKILEKIYCKPLDLLFDEKIALPLRLKNSGFHIKGENAVNANERDDEIGIVNDYNCRHLGGVAGNAGLFSSLNDLTEYVKMLLSGGNPIIKKETLENAVKNHTPTMAESRGLGFLYVDERYTQTGRLFKKGSFGHCGHTGQSVFVDAESGFFTIILSDMTLKVNDEYNRVIKAREIIHNAIWEETK